MESTPRVTPNNCLLFIFSSNINIPRNNTRVVVATFHRELVIAIPSVFTIFNNIKGIVKKNNRYNVKYMLILSNEYFFRKYHAIISTTINNNSRLIAFLSIYYN